MFKKTAILCLVLAPFTAGAMEFKISTLYPEGTSEVRALREAGTKIQNATEGRVNLRVYPGGVMGDDSSVERRIRIGQLHGALVQGGALTDVYKDLQILNAPFAFNDYKEVDYVRSQLDADLQKELRNRQYRTFGFIDGGFAHIMSRTPITSIEDFRQQKLWLPATSRMSELIARSFGISPIMLNVSEVLTSLQTGLIDTIIAPPAGALTLQWFSRLNYITDLPLIYTFGVLYIHERHFSRISTEDQETVSKILTETVSKMNENSRENNLAAYRAIMNQNITEIKLSDEQIKSIRNNADDAIALLINSGEFSQKWIDRLVSTLNDYRTNNIDDPKENQEEEAGVEEEEGG